jgi:hypothetical protein
MGSVRAEVELSHRGVNFRPAPTGQTEQAQQLCRVPGQPLVTRLPMSKQVLDHMERMLDLGADAGLHLLRTFGQVLRLDELVELAPLATTHESPRDSWRLIGLSQAATVVA